MNMPHRAIPARLLETFEAQVSALNLHQHLPLPLCRALTNCLLNAVSLAYELGRNDQQQAAIQHRIAKFQRNPEPENPIP